MVTQLKSYSTIGLFVVYSFFSIAITYLIQAFLLTDNVFHNNYAEQLSYDRIEEIIDGQKKWAWVSYVILPILYAVKFFLVACCLLGGSMFFDIKLKFNEAFKVAILSDGIFIVSALIKLLWFLVVEKNYNLQDIQLFSPFSVLNIFDVKSISILWLYPLQTLNIFELLYIFLLGFWVYRFGAKNYERGLNMVIASYVPALIMWIVVIMFITLNLNPNA